MKTKKVLFILAMAGFVVMADNWVVSPILPFISDDIGVNVASAAIIISAYMLPFGLFQLIFGYLGDRFGRIRVISIAMVFFTISTGLCAIATDLTGLTIFRALTGLFAGSVMPVSLALIGDLVPLNERQAAIGAFFGVAFLGQGLSTAIGGSISYFFNWRGVFLIYALISVIPTILIFSLRKNIPVIKNPGTPFLAPIVSLLTNFKSLSIYIFVFFEGVFIIGTFSFLGAFIKNQYDFNALIIGLIMSMFGIMSVVGGNCAGKVSKKMGYKNTIIIGLVFALMANIIYILGADLIAVVIIGIGFAGLGLMLAHSTFLTIVSEFAAKSRGIATSLVPLNFMLGGSIGTAIGSKIIGHGDYASFFLIFAIGLVALIGAVLIIKKSFVIEHS